MRAMTTTRALALMLAPALGCVRWDLGISGVASDDAPVWTDTGEPSPHGGRDTDSVDGDGTDTGDRLPAVQSGGLVPSGQGEGEGEGLDTAHDPDPGLVAYYPFDEGTGAVAADHSGNGLHGVVVSATWTAGIDGTALAFGGEEAWVDLGDPDDLDIDSALTLEAWIAVHASTEDHQVIIGKFYEDDVYRKTYLLELQPDGQTVQMPIGESVVGDGYSPAASTIPVEFGRWVHVAGTYDGSTARIYVGGLETDTYATTGAIPVTSAPVFIGAHDSSGDRNGFQGAIDEVRIYRRALSPGEILDHAAGPPRGLDL